MKIVELILRLGPSKLRFRACLFKTIVCTVEYKQLFASLDVLLRKYCICAIYGKVASQSIRFSENHVEEPNYRHNARCVIIIT